MPAIPAPVTPQDERSESLSDDFMPMPRRSGMGWPSMILLALAAVLVTVFAVAQFRPDVAAGLVDFVRGPAAAPVGAGAAGGTPIATSVATATSRGAQAPGAIVGAAGEPPTVSVWSLPVARPGQAPAAPLPVVHGSMGAPAMAPPAPASHGRFEPSTAFAFTFKAAPQPAAAPNVADTQNVAPAPVEAPVQRPAPVVTPKAVEAESEPPPTPPAPAPSPVAAAPPPRPATPPPPPPKPRFAPGSLEDQIQKAVEADNAKKNQAH